ncbi:MAG TPA: peroxiredoxin-like family protein [Abditibacteriaceae bacterium]|jgi:peroxiredoxin
MNPKHVFVALSAFALAIPAHADAPQPSTAQTPAGQTSAPVTATPSVPTLATDVRPVLIGSTLPKINLRDTMGKVFDLNASVAKKPAVLIFYRGGWCPFCNIHLAQLRETEEPLKKLGYNILAISPDSAAKLGETAANNKLGYTLLSDSSMAASRALGIAFRLDDATAKKYRDYGIDLEKSSGYTHHQLPAPAVFLVGRDGVIHFSYVNPNYQVRLAPEVLLAAARAYRSDALKAPQ